MARFYFKIISKKQVMGILNVTPDSFSDGGKYFNIDDAVNRAEQIQADGADILDIGGQSTRPGCVRLTGIQELERVVPVFEALKNKIIIPISIDTFYPEVAEKALQLGASIINNVSGFLNKNMLKIVKKFNCKYIITHSFPGTNIRNFFELQIKEFQNIGISNDKIWLDPGIGFGKNFDDDFYILNNIAKFKIPGFKLMIGLSKKRIIGSLCNEPIIKNRAAGTLVANILCLLRGIDIVRVHDVQETVQAIKLLNFFNNYY